MKDNIKLRIKSPSAQTGDIFLDASVHQDVRSVKLQICDIYPTHPAPEDQKLVYSGRLLQDEQKLEKVLRFDDDSSHYTIHLVCRIQPPPTNNTTQQQNTISSTSANNNDNNDDGVRQRRNVSSQPVATSATLSEPQVSAPQLSDEAAQLETISRMLQDLVSNTNNLSVEEMSVYQQLYMQYISLNTQFIQSGGVIQNQPLLNNGQQANEALPGAAGVVAINNEGAPAPALVADGAGEEVGGAGGVDPLEYAYSILRIAILFCIMYSHSSFFRLLFVLLGILGIYYFRNRNQREEAAGGEEGGAAVDAVRQHQADNQVDTDQAHHSSDDTSTDAESEQEPKPNIFSVAFTFVSTLVSSILPENANLVQ